VPLNRVLTYSFWSIAFVLVILTWIFGLFIDLTGDSGLYAAISRQMVESGDWLNLKINGEPYDQKPHLFFWLAGLGIQFFGNTNWAFKLFPFLFGLSSIYFTYRLGRLVYSELSGRLAALLAGTSQIFFLYFFDFHTDTVLQAAVTLSIWQLAEYLENRNPVNFIFGFFAIGLAMLTKGPVGAVLPFFFVLFYLLLKKDFRQFLNPKWFLGILLVLVIISPTLYHLLKSFGAEGLRFYFIDNNRGRVTGEVAGSSNDPFFYLYNLLWAYLPWTIIFITALGGEIISWFFSPKRNKTGISMFGSVLVLFVVYSIARGKAPNYMMMFIPLLAVVAAGRMKYYLLWPSFLTNRLIYAQVFVLVLLSALLLYSGIKVMGSDVLTPALFLAGGTVLIGLYITTDRNRWNRLLFSTVVVAAVFNLFLNWQVIPFLFTYQGHTQAIEIFEKDDAAEKILYNFDLEEYELFFNAKDSVRNIATWEQLYEAMEKPGTWVYTSEDKLTNILFMGFPVDTVYKIEQRGMNQISREFLNQKTREESFSSNYLIKKKDREDATNICDGSASVFVSQKMGFHSPFFRMLFPGQTVNFIDIDTEDEYGPQAVIPLKGIRQKNQYTADVKLEYRGWSDFSEREVVLVFSVENENGLLLYNVYPLEWLPEDLNWKTVVFEAHFSADSPQPMKLKAYIWNRGQEQLALKSMEVIVSGY
jgi:4-amino-4-deoxy-L-arabinose transferase-like glycosyltransferase